MIEAIPTASQPSEMNRVAREARAVAGSLEGIRPGVLSTDSRAASDAAEASAVLDIIRDLSASGTESVSTSQQQIEDAAARAERVVSWPDRYVQRHSNFENRTYRHIDLGSIDKNTITPELLLPTDFLEFTPGNSTQSQAREIALAGAAGRLGLTTVDPSEFFVWVKKLKETHVFASVQWPTFSGLTQEQSRELVIEACARFEHAAMLAEDAHKSEQQRPVSRARSMMESIRADIDIALLSILGQGEHLPHKLALDPYGRTTAIIHQLKQMTHHE